MTEQPSVILCPYCGNAQTEPRDRCTACGGHFDELSLKATQGHMGPWFVRDRANPFRPGCSYEVLVKEIERGRVTATTILRGPTTRQFWSIAQNVPGVAHHLGYCHACGKTVKPGSSACEHCGEVFFAPTLKDNLGLAPAGTPVRLPQNEAAPVEQTPPVAPTDPDYPVAEAAATREALAWMTSQQQKPDTLDTAESPIAPTIQESRSNTLTTVLILVNAAVLAGIVFVGVMVFKGIGEDGETDTATVDRANPGLIDTNTVALDDNLDDETAVTVDDPEDQGGSDTVVDPTVPPLGPIEFSRPIDISELEQKLSAGGDLSDIAWMRQTQYANALDRAGKLDEALRLYELIRLRGPTEIVPDDIERRIESLQQRVLDRDTDAFFLGT